jgi:hypothetical protein
MPTPLPLPLKELRQAVKELEASLLQLKRVVAKEEDTREKQKIQSKLKKSS